MDGVSYRPLLEMALREDLGLAGDLTTEAVVPDGVLGTASILARRPGRLAGIDVALEVFAILDGALELRRLCVDGTDVDAGETLARVSGPIRPILTGERVALNLLGRLSGIATATRDLVRAVEGTGATVTDTRKTTPGLRALEKHAVRMGGGNNHRFGLGDLVLIKDNHIAAAGGITKAVAAARRRVGHWVKIEVEVDSLDQLAELLADPVDAVLLDNMATSDLRAAVEMVDGRMIVEASGGITSESIRAVAETGVDVISVGWLTHSAPSLDVALDLAGHQIET